MALQPSLFFVSLKEPVVRSGWWSFVRGNCEAAPLSDIGNSLGHADYGPRASGESVPETGGGDAVSAPQIARSVFARPCGLGGFSDAGPPDLVRIPATCARGIIPASHDRCEFLVG